NRGLEHALMNPAPSENRDEVADDAEAPSDGRENPPLERGREQVDEEEESDDDAIPHQVDVESGFGSRTLARPLIGLVRLGGSLKAFAESQTLILLRIGIRFRCFLLGARGPSIGLLVEHAAHLAFELRGMALELVGHPAFKA